MNYLNTFSEFGLSKFIQDCLVREGFTEPTEVQVQSIPFILAGNDLMASAQTGSGKTAAYALPIIDQLKKTRKDGVPRALIMVPTRELALQVKEQFERFGRHLRVTAVYGGTGYLRQYRQFARGVDIIVATPGRLFDLAEQNVANLSEIQTLVLDEADRLMDMGFMPQIRKIVARVPAVRQTLMFSATIDQKIEEMAREYLTRPHIVRSTANQLDASSIEQKIHYLREFAKDEFLLELISGFTESSVDNSVLIFTQTRRKATFIADKLRAADVQAEEIHGEIKQNRREKIMARYRSGDFKVLVATDIAARGLDIPHISHVVNYDLPTSAEDYVHRIGRTGRAGKTGIAHSFVSHEQRYLLRDIENILGRRFEAPPQLFSAGAPKPRPFDRNGAKPRGFSRFGNDKPSSKFKQNKFKSKRQRVV